MTPEQLTHFKQMLVDEKTRLETERKMYADDDRTDTEDDAAGELSHSDVNDPADEATNLFDRERDRAAIGNMDRMLGKVNRALEKMDEGTYGLSEIDGTPIPLERLEVLPYALLTVDQEDSA